MLLQNDQHRRGLDEELIIKCKNCHENTSFLVFGFEGRLYRAHSEKDGKQLENIQEEYEGFKAGR